MKYVYTEKLIFTKEEFEILDKASILLDDIYVNAHENSAIKSLACIAMENISDLLSGDYSDLE